jgi:putative spermidine/putrescine transport system substrate-binding protein
MAVTRRTVLRAGAGLVGASFISRGSFAAELPPLPAGLIEAARKEGQLNLIATPRDWANYGKIMDDFGALTGVKIDSANPNGSSAEELQAIRSLRSQSRAPDTVDVGPSFAQIGANENLFQPYKVKQWASVPDAAKDPNGLWTGCYFGVVSFGTNMSVVKNAPHTWADLLKTEYKGMVTLTNSPLGSASAFAAVFAASLANGGSYDDIMPGIEFFAKLAAARNYSPVGATTATLVSGQTPIVIDWDYLNLARRDQAKGKTDIQTALAEGAPAFGSFYAQGISAYAPHPNAAKLWEEYLFSDQGQIDFLGGYAHPIRFNELFAAGKISEEMLAALPPAEAYKSVKFATVEQSAKASEVLKANWSKMVKF